MFFPERFKYFRKGFTTAVKGLFRGKDHKNGDYSIPFGSARVTVSLILLFVPRPAAASNVERFIVVAFVSHCVINSLLLNFKIQ